MVVAAGILHCFTDPVAVICEMARVASKAVSIESTHISLYESGVLDEDRDVYARGLAQLAPQAICNKTGGEHSFRGLAVVPSRELIASLFAASGFDVQRVYVRDDPAASRDDTAMFTTPAQETAACLPKRFFLRCVRSDTRPVAADRIPNTASLEGMVISGDGAVQSWSSQPRYWSYTAGVEIEGTRGASDDYSTDTADDTTGTVAATTAPCASQRICPLRHQEASKAETRVVREGAGASKAKGLGADEENELTAGTAGGWVFDMKVAKRFDREASCHIPDYREVINLSVDTVIRAAEVGGGCRSRLRIIDIGCATGNTIRAFLSTGFELVSGVDCSPSMLDQAREKLPDGVALHCDTRLPPASANEPEARYHAIIANWTLIFIPELAERLAYIRDIYANLVPGGVLVLTEKTNQDEAVRDMYWDFKRRRGVSEKEIQAKAMKLQGVLITQPASWYDSALSDAGFKSISVAWARYGFVTFIARKSGEWPGV